MIESNRHEAQSETHAYWLLNPRLAPSAQTCQVDLPTETLGRNAVSPNSENLRRYCSNRSGFTLIEMMVVCLILSMIAAAIVYSVSGRIGNARMTAAIEQIESADRFARDLARQQNSPVILEINAAEGVILVRSNRRTHKRLNLPQTIEVNNVSLSSGQRGDRILVTRLGQTPTYVVELTSQDENTRWLGVAGLSGQSWRSTDRNQSLSLLRL